MRAIRVLSAVAAVGAWVVLVLGKIVHVTGASTSIPDWPLAFGKVVPKMKGLMVWEWSHRAAVLVVFVATAALVVCAVRMGGKLWMYCAGAMGLLLVPAAIGAMTVVGVPLHWGWVVVDFGSAVMFMGMMTGLAVWARMVGRSGQVVESSHREVVKS